MNYNHPNKNGSTVTIRVMCAIVFVLFSFCWLFFFQSDVLMMAQHVLSNGLTHYNSLVGAILITLSLVILQLVVYASIRLKKRMHAFTYLPSMLALAMISSVTMQGDTGVEYGFSWWLVVLILILWLAFMLVARLAQEVEEDSSYNFVSRPMWINMLIMSLMMICVAWIGNTNAVFPYRMKVERCLLEGDVDGALKVGKKSLESDGNLLMLRMFALARRNQLGEHLFEYPVTGSSAMMLPTDSLSSVVMYPADSLYRLFGARPASKMSPARYLELIMQRDTVQNMAAADYLLCGYLIDRQIDRFAHELTQYYAVNDSLPKHYREALTLYTHLRSHPVIVYHYPVMDEDYDNLQELEKQYPRQSERHVKVEEQYRGTYWYYYEYE